MSITRHIDGATVCIPIAVGNTDYDAWVAAGNQVPAEQEPALTLEAASAMIQGHVDTVARAKGYADGVAVASYASSTIPAWAEEAAAFVAWRDAVWVASYTALAAIQAGERQMPTREALIAELPPITW